VRAGSGRQSGSAAAASDRVGYAGLSDADLPAVGRVTGGV